MASKMRVCQGMRALKALSVDDASLSGLRRSITTPSRVSMIGHNIVNDGKEIEVAFSDNTSYRFHAPALKDCSQEAVGADLYRHSVKSIWSVRSHTISQAKVENNELVLKWHYDCVDEHGGGKDTFPALLLKAMGPSMGKALHHSPPASAATSATTSLFESLEKKRSPWHAATLQVPEFDAVDLANSVDLQIDLLQKSVDPGFAIVHNLPRPQDQSQAQVGLVLESFVQSIVGRINQHPVRSTRFGVIQSTAKAKDQGADYNTSNPLSMHTDHSTYAGTPGYLQFMHQALGSVNTVITDGLAVAEYMREHHPEQFELLATVQLTHGFCNMLYRKDGSPRNVMNATFDPQWDAAFELVNTKPVLKLKPDGSLQQVIHSESKRALSGIPFDLYHPFMDAYENWLNLVEDPRFKKKVPWPEGSMIVINNWRVLHGRALQDPGTSRTMTFGYCTRAVVDSRYRLLRRLDLQSHVPELDTRFATRVDHQVLGRMCEAAGV